MARKVVIVADPGIDGACALALALQDPAFEVLAVGATAGNVGPAQATRNVHTVVEQVDPPRWPRVGAALPVEYDVDGKALHGPSGLGGAELPCAQLHHPHSADKLLIDLARQYPKEVVVLVLGPATALARAIDRDPGLPALLQRVVWVGGAWREPGDASAVAEFHFYCDPPAARQVLRCGAPLTLIPLDVSRTLLFSPTDLTELLAADTGPCAFLRKLVPHALRVTANTYGVEGCYLPDVAGVVALAVPEALARRAVAADVETRGELTRGMCVIDLRPTAAARPNAEMVVHLDAAAARQYVARTLACRA